MNRRCDTCGFRSADASFFRRERGGLFGLPKTVCDGCVALQPPAHDKRAFRDWVIWRVVWLILLGFAAMNEPAEAAGLLAFMLAVWVSRPVATTVHEFGHALFAAIAGLQVTSVTVGSGPSLASFRWGVTRFELRAYTFTGGLTGFVDLRARPARWRIAVAILGGPLANAIILGLTIGLMVLQAGVEGSNEIGAALLAGVAFSQGSALFISLMPLTYRTGLVSDGKRLLGLLKAQPTQPDAKTDAMTHSYRLMRAQRFGAAALAFQEIVNLCPDDPLGLGLLIHCISRAQGDAAAFDYYVEHRDRFDIAAENPDEATRVWLPWLHANVAWAAVKAGDPANRPLAEALARDAVLVFPDAPELKGTFGAVLVEKGETSEGLSLLRDAARGITDPIDKADFCTFLAKGEHARGDTARAQDFEDLRQHILASA